MNDYFHHSRSAANSKENSDIDHSWFFHRPISFNRLDNERFRVRGNSILSVN